MSRFIVDLASARQARQPAAAHWSCSVCDLVAGGFTPTECAYLADVHDRLQHGSRPTARVIAGPAPAAEATASLGIGA